MIRMEAHEAGRSSSRTIDPELLWEQNAGSGRDEEKPESRQAGGTGERRSA